jgi:uncharacterized membrane protein
MNEPAVERTGEIETARIIYVLYLVGIAVGITSIVGVVMAYINRDTAPEWLKTHYEFQIRTFWISLLYGFVSFLLCFIIIGFVLLFALVVWLIIRCVKGLKGLEQRAPVADPKGWGF